MVLVHTQKLAVAVLVLVGTKVIASVGRKSASDPGEPNNGPDPTSLPPLSATPWPRSAGVAALLTTARDRPLDWINAGQALQRILLTASTSGVAAALHTQPLELGWLRETIRTQLCEGAYPQLMLRFGMVIQAAASVRRLPDDILSAPGAEPPGSSNG